MNQPTTTSSASSKLRTWQWCLYPIVGTLVVGSLIDHLYNISDGSRIDHVGISYILGFIVMALLLGMIHESEEHQETKMLAKLALRAEKLSTKKSVEIDKDTAERTAYLFFGSRAQAEIVACINDAEQLLQPHGKYTNTLHDQIVREVTMYIVAGSFLRVMDERHLNLHQTENYKQRLVTMHIEVCLRQVHDKEDYMALWEAYWNANSPAKRRSVFIANLPEQFLDPGTIPNDIYKTMEEAIRYIGGFVSKKDLEAIVGANNKLSSAFKDMDDENETQKEDL